jgi:hypothetical protein
LALGVYLAVPMALLILTLLWYRAHGLRPQPSYRLLPNERVS